jgi:hypothetical protein
LAAPWGFPHGLRRDATHFLPLSDPFNGSLKRPTLKANSCKSVMEYGNLNTQVRKIGFLLGILPSDQMAVGGEAGDLAY